MIATRALALAVLIGTATGCSTEIGSPGETASVTGAIEDTGERCGARAMSVEETDLVEAELDTFATSIGITPIEPGDPVLTPPIGSGAPFPIIVTPREPFDARPMLREGIPVAFHVIHTSEGIGDVPDEVLEEQLVVLNASYGGATSPEASDSGFQFYLLSIDRTESDLWFRMQPSSSEERQAKRELRVGDRSTLNFYTSSGGAFAGWGTFPWDYDDDPELDGVVVAYNTLPGNEGPYGLGDTGTHEVGHWLGLWHTHALGCNPPGDRVADTPAQADEALGCQIGRDTCPSLGLDPIFNFMGYSDDDCMNQFTRGQAYRMFLNAMAFRRCSSGSCARVRFVAL